MSTNPTQTTNRWWLALEGRPDGPRTTAYVTAGLQTGQLTLTTPVCPEGGSEWRPLGTWPMLAALASAPTCAPPPPPLVPGAPTPPFSAGSAERLLTNSALPPMGNLICIYAILVVPLYWILNFVTVFNDDNPFLEETWFYLAYGINLIVMQLASLGITISLAIGGVRLRDLRASGERLVRLTLSLGLVLVAMQWIFFLAMLILGGLAGAWEESSGSSISIFDTLQTALQTAAFFWDIVCLVWLLRNRSRLPLILNS